MTDFKPDTKIPTDNIKLNYQLDKLYGQAFPQLANMALFKVEGLKDLAKGKVSNLAGLGYRMPVEGKKESAVLDYTGIETVSVDEDTIVSYLGTPIFFPIKIGAGTYNVLQNGKVVAKSFPKDIYLPATATAEFKRSKIVGRTEINASEGSIKEFWAFSDWNITIRGLVLTERNNLNGANAMVFPDEELLSLFRYEQITDSVEVSGKLFQILGIKRICILEMQLQQVTGSPNAIPFTLQCLSDNAAELILKDNKIIQK